MFAVVVVGVMACGKRRACFARLGGKNDTPLLIFSGSPQKKSLLAGAVQVPYEFGRVPVLQRLQGTHASLPTFPPALHTYSPNSMCAET